MMRFHPAAHVEALHHSISAGKGLILGSILTFGLDGWNLQISFHVGKIFHEKPGNKQ